MKLYPVIIGIILNFYSCSQQSSISSPEELNSSGKIIFQTDPEAAGIYIGGISTGKLTPDSIINLKPGDYEVSLLKTGYIGQRFNVKIDSNETESVTRVLEEDRQYWWTAYNLFNLNISDRHVFCIAVDHNNIKWMGIGSSGLVKFNDSTWIIINEQMPGSSPGYVLSLDVDSRNNIWMGTKGGGLCKFDGVMGWTYYRPDNSNIPGSDAYINKIDINDHCWLLVRNEIEHKQYISFFDGTDFTNYDSSNAPFDLLNKEIRDICCLKDGTILIGSSENGIYKFDGSDFIEDNSVYDIRAIYQDGNGIVWIVDRDNQVFSGDFGNWNFVSSNSGGSSRIIMVEGTNIWIGGFASGVSRYDGSNWRDYDGVIQTLLNGDDVEQISVDKNGYKWIATTGGVLRRK